MKAGSILRDVVRRNFSVEDIVNKIAYTLEKLYGPRAFKPRRNEPIRSISLENDEPSAFDSLAILHRMGLAQAEGISRYRFTPRAREFYERLVEEGFYSTPGYRNYIKNVSRKTA